MEKSYLAAAQGKKSQSPSPSPPATVVTGTALSPPTSGVDNVLAQQTNNLRRNGYKLTQENLVGRIKQCQNVVSAKIVKIDAFHDIFNFPDGQLFLKLVLSTNTELVFLIVFNPHLNQIWEFKLTEFNSNKVYGTASIGGIDVDPCISLQNYVNLIVQNVNNGVEIKQQLKPY
jgi:hypothetical protein